MACSYLSKQKLPYATRLVPVPKHFVLQLTKSHKQSIPTIDCKIWVIFCTIQCTSKLFAKWPYNTFVFWLYVYVLFWLYLFVNTQFNISFFSRSKEAHRSVEIIPQSHTFIISSLKLLQREILQCLLTHNNPNISILHTTPHTHIHKMYEKIPEM